MGRARVKQSNKAFSLLVPPAAGTLEDKNVKLEPEALLTSQSFPKSVPFAFHVSRARVPGFGQKFTLGMSSTKAVEEGMPLTLHDETN